MLDPTLVSCSLGLFVGLVMSVTGAGGSIVSLPMLVFVFNLNMVAAAAISLLAVMLSASVAAVLGLRDGLVRYKAAGLLAMCGILIAPAGVWCAHKLPDQVLWVLFVLIMLTVAFRSFISSTKQNYEMQAGKAVNSTCEVHPVTSRLLWTKSCARRLVFTGGLAGFLSGLLGLGGGFIIVPALRKVSNLESRMIIATSLTVVAIVSATSMITYAMQSSINWTIALPFVAGALMGMLTGRLFSHKIPGQISQRIFAIFTFLIAIVFIIKLVIAFV